MNNVQKMVEEMSNNRNAITTTQLRKLLSNTLVIANKIKMLEMEGKLIDGKLSGTLKNDIKVLKVRHIYQCGRDEKVKLFDEVAKISKKIDDIADDVETFKEFHRYIEEIVAYVKYYKG